YQSHRKYISTCVLRVSRSLIGICTPPLTMTCRRLLSETCICGITSHSLTAPSVSSRAATTSTIGTQLRPKAGWVNVLPTAVRQNTSLLPSVEFDGNEMPPWNCRNDRRGSIWPYAPQDSKVVNPLPSPRLSLPVGNPTSSPMLKIVPLRTS